MDFKLLTALELGTLIHTGDATWEDAVRAATPDRLNAFITRTLPTAKAGDSPLAGVPMAFKDNLCTRGTPTTCASKMLADFVPPYSATAVERLTSAGAVSLGKLNMDEFAMGSTSETSYFGPVHNPWNVDHSPGGSSGGAAAAVADGQVWYAIGSDTGGSIRQPAAHCGVTGVKPTYGTVSRYGLVAYASSLDQLGPIARSAADCAAVLDILMGHDGRDSTSLNCPTGTLLASLDGNLRGKRIGIPAECFADGLDRSVSSAVLATAEVLKSRGATVETCSLPLLKYAVPAYYILASAEASSNLSRYDGIKYGYRATEYDGLVDLYKQTRTRGFGDECQRRILLGTFVLSAGYYDAYYLKALKTRAAIKAEFDAAFQMYDLLLTPVTPSTAPRLGESLDNPLKMYLSDIYTVPINLAGLPALSMPCGFESAGLPIGAQLIGPVLGEQAILNAAHGYQLETDWHKRTPKESVDT